MGQGLLLYGKANLLPCGTCGNRFDKWIPGLDALIDHKYVFNNVGYNLKPLDMQGAIGIAQLKKFDEIDKKRKYNFNKVKKALEQCSYIRVASSLPEADPCWFGVPVICKSQAVKDSLASHLEKNKVQTRNYFAGNLLWHGGYRHLDDAHTYPNANLALSHVFFVGCPPHYTEEIIEYIEKVVSEWKPPY